MVEFCAGPSRPRRAAARVRPPRSDRSAGPAPVQLGLDRVGAGPGTSHRKLRGHSESSDGRAGEGIEASSLPLAGRYGGKRLRCLEAGDGSGDFLRWIRSPTEVVPEELPPRRKTRNDFEHLSLSWQRTLGETQKRRQTRPPTRCPHGLLRQSGPSRDERVLLPHGGTIRRVAVLRGASSSRWRSAAVVDIGPMVSTAGAHSVFKEPAAGGRRRDVALQKVCDIYRNINRTLYENTVRSSLRESRSFRGQSLSPGPTNEVSAGQIAERSPSRQDS
jgi:hypothetical protein